MGLGSKVWVGGLICAISLPNCLTLVTWVHKCMSKHKLPPFFGSQLVFRPNQLSAWACLQGKNVHFLKTMEARCLDAIWVSGVVQYNSQGCLAKFYGLGCWGWAVVGSDSWEVNKLIRLCQEALGATCFAGKARTVKTQLIRFTREGLQKSGNYLFS